MDQSLRPLWKGRRLACICVLTKSSEADSRSWAKRKLEAVLLAQTYRRPTAAVTQDQETKQEGVVLLPPVLESSPSIPVAESGGDRAGGEAWHTEFQLLHLNTEERS